MEASEVKLSRHAAKRIKQRTAYSKTKGVAAGEKALKFGRPSSEFRGAFRKYLDKMSIKYHTIPIVYQGSIYIFGKNKVLVTVLAIQVKFHKYLKQVKNNESEKDASVEKRS